MQPQKVKHQVPLARPRHIAKLTPLFQMSTERLVAF